MVRVILFLLIFLSLPLSIQAEEQFYLDVSPRAGTTDDTFILSVVLENMDQNAKPYLIGGDDFEVQLMGPRQSTTIINGNVTSELAYNYQLTPKKEGLLESPSAEIEVAGKKYTAAAIKVRVSKGQNPDGSAAGDSLILKQSLSSNKVYVGEQVQHILSLYSSIPIYDYNFNDQLLDGFWSQSAGDVDKSQSELNNQRYNLFRWYKALYPLKTGSLKITEREMSAKVQGPRRNRSFPFGRTDPFDDPFNSFFGAVETVQKNLKSNSLELEVLPLPQKPENFENWGLTNTLVGETEIELRADDSALNTGESKTLTLIIKSKGNLNGYNQIPLKETSTFRIYQDNPQEKNFLDGSELVMSKIFKISLIPLKPGIFHLPPFKLSYFDPRTGQYKVAETPKLEFQVNGKDLTEGKEPLSQENTQLDKELNSENKPKSAETEPKIVYQEDSFLKKLSNEVSLSLSLLILAALGVAFYAFSLLRRTSSQRYSKIKITKEVQSSKDADELAKIALRCLETATSPESRFQLQSLIDKLDTIRYSREKQGIESIPELKSELSAIIREL